MEIQVHMITTQGHMHIYTQYYYIHCSSHIILMLSDDMACNPRNQYPGECRALLMIIPH